MAILAYGINYRTAPIEVRERIAFTTEEIGSGLKALTDNVADIKEAAIISTCNRTELILATDNLDTTPVARWLSDYGQISLETLKRVAYTHRDENAAEHLIKVASGLDSQVLGEPQILGQVKDAYEMARAAGTLGSELSLLSQITINWAKQIRSKTGIGQNPVSVAYAAIMMAQQIFSKLEQKHVLLIGAGDTIRRVGEHLNNVKIGSIVIANRSLDNAATLASKFGAESIEIDEIEQRLHDFDIVISSTGSASNILGKKEFLTAVKTRKNKPVFIVDLAVPRDIDPSVSSIENIYLYTIDDLTDVIEENVSKRLVEAELGKKLATEGAEQYMREYRLRQSNRLLTSFREAHTKMADIEKTKALKALETGENPEKIISSLANNLINKLLHRPTIGIREASANDQNSLVELIKKLYDLD
tara:strand:+ start:363 stop:1616 length:1254 start_codon:yes stop_codon:yes gene_type:complete